MLLEAAPDFELCISYKMLGYGANSKDNLFNLNAQKNYVGLNVGQISKIDENGDMLSDYDCGKGCIRLKRTTDLSDPKLKEYIAKAVKLWREGVELGC